jgi:hypothetical protein
LQNLPTEKNLELHDIRQIRPRPLNRFFFLAVLGGEPFPSDDPESPWIGLCQADNPAPD